MSYYYVVLEDYVPNYSFEEMDWLEFNSKYISFYDIKFLAEEMAEDYFNNSDGWERSWPLTFRIHDGIGLFNDVEVEMEAVPTFYAREK